MSLFGNTSVTAINGRIENITVNNSRAFILTRALIHSFGADRRALLPIYDCFYKICGQTKKVK